MTPHKPPDVLLLLLQHLRRDTREAEATHIAHMQREVRLETRVAYALGATPAVGWEGMGAGRGKRGMAAGEGLPGEAEGARHLDGPAI